MSWDNPTLLDNEEAAVDGSFFSSHFSPDTDEPSARAFIDAYQALYGIAPTGGDAVSYDAVRLLLEAARATRVASTRTPMRRQLLATEQYAGATRIAGYDENRHPTKSAVIMTIENGAKKFYQQVDP